MKTIVLKTEEVTPNWCVIDATDKPVGRLATRIAMMLMGKHRPDYTPHVLCGDFVVVTNVEKVKFTGRKWQQQTYVKYTGYPSGQRTITAEKMRELRPEAILRLAVQRMLPKTKLGYQMIRRLKLYQGSAHPHQAQQPTQLQLEL